MTEPSSSPLTGATPADAPAPDAPADPAAEVGAALSTAGLLVPAFPGRHLGAVLPAVAAALGARDVRGAADARGRLGLPNARRACVVLVDGLGRHNLSERAGHAPFLRSLLQGSPALRSGFPSTTAASIASFGTGTPAGRHGLVGYSVRVPGTGALANMVSWNDGADPHAWQREPTVFEQLQDGDIAVTSVGPARFAGSGLTEAALRGARYVGAESLPERVDAAAAELVGRSLVYLYWGDLDKAGHHHGWGSSQWGDELSAVDSELARLARSLPRGTSLYVTADHGMVDVDPLRRWDVAATPALADGVVVVAGEPRALHLHVTRPGEDAGPDEVAARARGVVGRWRETLGPAAVVVTGADAIAAGWFGDVAEHVRPLIGDVVVAMAGRATVVDSRTQSPGSLELVGVHGSLTPHEVVVPFLAVQA
ncbi:alkaline phosphatase family protein [Cellulomonas sp. 179-A 4D5 NHS]|uniref:alkaline phosphatase family protein n=1 Tax=Cellulomonas sp. 179-A 4D5 NHS TaxID=3142378 RepID=UPI0039A3063C